MEERRFYYLGISKRGDVYLRSLLVQGVRAVLNAKLRFTTEAQKNKKDFSKFTEWMFNLSERCGHNKTTGAIANKLARVVFAVLSSGNDYSENKEEIKNLGSVIEKSKNNLDSNKHEELKQEHFLLTNQEKDISGEANKRIKIADDERIKERANKLRNTIDKKSNSYNRYVNNKKNTQVRGI